MMDKWTLLVLYTLEHKDTLRFKEIKLAIPDIMNRIVLNPDTIDVVVFCSKDYSPPGK